MTITIISFKMPCFALFAWIFIYNKSWIYVRYIQWTQRLNHIKELKFHLSELGNSDHISFCTIHNKMGLEKLQDESVTCIWHFKSSRHNAKKWGLDSIQVISESSFLLTSQLNRLRKQVTKLLFPKSRDNLRVSFANIIAYTEEIL